MSETKKRKVHSAGVQGEGGTGGGARGQDHQRDCSSVRHSSGASGQVGQWKKEIQEQARTLFEGRRGPQPVAAHNQPERLYGEIGRLKMELDWLKKKSGMSLP